MLRKVGVFIVGWLIVIGGLILVPLPGPGWAIVFVGLSLLATEFAWAARLKNRVQEWLAAWLRKAQAWRGRRRRLRESGAASVVVHDGVTDLRTTGADGSDHLVTVETLAAPRPKQRRAETDEDSLAS